MARVYLDNAATTILDRRVIEAMEPFFTGKYGNPSSIHANGREVRTAIEEARRKIAELLCAAPSEIFFTSGGTEAINTVLRSLPGKHSIQHVISSPIEHQAVLHTLEYLEQTGDVQVHFVNLNNRGQIDLNHLEELLVAYPGSLVSLMHANNEIGNILNIDVVADLCARYRAWFHCDTVQSIGHLPFNLSQQGVHAIAGSAHKFHGPKGIGFMYIDADLDVSPLLVGGGQERNMRGGTENVYGIIGLARALELAYDEREKTTEHLTALKNYAIKLLTSELNGVVFNGMSAGRDDGLSKILSIGLPGMGENEMLIFNLDINGISVSGGSACASGSSIGSHVLNALEIPSDMATIRISFSKFNTNEEIDIFVQKLKMIINENYKS